MEEQDAPSRLCDIASNGEQNSKKTVKFREKYLDKGIQFWLERFVEWSDH
jgi:hypothetical protein